MEIVLQIPDGQVDRIALAYSNGPGSFGQEVTAANLSEVLAAQFSEEIRRAVQSHEAGQAATAAARAVADAQDPLSTKKGDTFASVQEAVAEARSARVEAAAEAKADELVEVKG